MALWIGAPVALWIGAACASAPAPAAPPPAPGPSSTVAAEADQIVAVLAERLALDPAQQTKVREAALRLAERNGKILSGPPETRMPGRRGYRPALGASLDLFEREISPALTPEQRAKYRALRLELQSRFPGARSAPPVR